jgi:hypothetical protein
MIVVLPGLVRVVSKNKNFGKIFLGTHFRSNYDIGTCKETVE